MGPPEIKALNNEQMADNTSQRLPREEEDQKFVHQPGDTSGMLVRHSIEGPVLQVAA